MSDNEFPYPIQVDSLSDTPKKYTLETNEAQRNLIAKRLEIPSVAALGGTVNVVRHGKIITVKGNVSASLDRLCVITLEPLVENIEEELEVEFTLEANKAVDHDDYEDVDAPEPVIDGLIDIGEVLVQQVAIAMAAYPKSTDAQFEEITFGEEVSPFAVLKAFKTEN